MLDVALKNVLNKKMRTALSAIAVMTAVVLFTVLNCMVEAQRGLMDEFKSPFEGKVIVLQGGKGSLSMSDYMIGLRSEVDNNTVSELLSDQEIIKGVKTYEMCYITAIVEGGYGPSVYMMGITNISNDHNYFFNGKLSKEALGMDLDKVALVGSVAAEAMGISEDKVGQVVELKTPAGRAFNLTVGMIIKDSDNFLAQFSVITGLKWLQDTYQRYGFVSFVAMEPMGSESALGKAIEARFQWRLDAVTTEEYVDMVNKNNDSNLVFFNAISTMALIISGVMIMSTGFTTARERQKEIATLRACGAPRWWVLGLFLLESLITSLIGGLISIPIGYALLAMVWGEGVYVWSVALQGILIGMVIGPIGGLIPAARAALGDPLRGLIYE